MTKKDFKALAAALRGCRPAMYSNGHDLSSFYMAWDDCRDAIADACQQSNPAFSRSKFYEACNE